MKKNLNDMRLLVPCSNPKFWKIMKLTVVFMILGMVQISASTYSQTFKMDLKRGQSTFQQVFDQIEKQSTYTIFYKDDLVDVQTLISRDIDDATLVDVLDRTLEGTGLTYKIVDKLIVILEKAPEHSTQDERKEIKGKVTDTNGEPLPGVNVIVEGTLNGTITNFDGEYALTIDAVDPKLMFSFIGFETQVVTIGERTQINIVLADESISLDEVVAIGFGFQKKSDLTGAVASVKGDELTKVSTANPAEQLQGRMAGVSVTSIGGAPGAAMDIKIRGASTLNNNNPLVIIDNVPGDMQMLNPADIQSIEVLKDGAAAAIYGTEAANGVILITTKKGESGKMNIDFSTKFASQVQTSNLQMANSEQHIKVANMMYDNAGESKPEYLSETYSQSTDWVDEVFRTAPLQEYNLSFRGGSDNINYYLSTGWIDQEGTVIGTDYQKANLRTKIDFSGDFLNVGMNISYNETKRDQLSLSIRETYEILPMIPVYDASNPSGFGYGDSSKGMLLNNNPVGVEHFNDSEFTEQYFSGVGYLSFDIIEGLNFRFEAGLNNSNQHSFLHHPSYNVNPKEQELYPVVSESRTNIREYNINNVLNYTKQFGDHNIGLMGAYVLKRETAEWMDAGISGFKNIYTASGDILNIEEEPTGFLDERFNTLDAGLDGQSTVGGSRNAYSRASMLGRFNYSYKHRYLVQATVRRDGSSKFGSDYRYGTFPSVALGWRLSEEQFMADYDFLSNLKIRASYGVLGNENSLKVYEYMALMTSSTGESLSYSQGGGETTWLGTISRELENLKYRWETTTTQNYGFDFGILNNKLSGGFNYYSNETTDMLVKKPIPMSSGLNASRINFGEMTNSGIELELNFQNKIGEFKYGVFGALSTTKNEVTKLGNENEFIPGAALNYTEHFAHQTKVGYALGSYFLYQTDGIFNTPEEVSAHKNKDGVVLQPDAAPGDIRFKDVNGDGVINPDDKLYSGVGIPKYNYSFSIDASYKGFDFSMLLHGSGGHKIYNGNRYYYESMRTPRNMFATTANAWTPTNKNTDMPRAIFGDPNQNSRESNRFLEDGNFMRIKMIQLGYTIPNLLTGKVKISKARVYFSGQNLFTFTKYSGQDPEIGRGDVWSPGLDTTLYPISKMYVVGIQVSL